MCARHRLGIRALRQKTSVESDSSEEQSSMDSRGRREGAGGEVSVSCDGRESRWAEGSCSGQLPVSF